MTTAIVPIPRESCQLEVKRLYLPFIIESDCPECGEMATTDLTSDQYLIYPVVGEPEQLYFSCRECNHDWSIFVVLGVTLTLEEDST